MSEAHAEIVQMIRETKGWRADYRLRRDRPGLAQRDREAAGLDALACNIRLKALRQCRDALVRRIGVRLSVDDEDFNPEVGRRARIYLDGKLIEKVRTADEEQGFVVRCVLDENGRVQVNPNNRDEIWVERLDGRVQIRMVGG